MYDLKNISQPPPITPKATGLQGRMQSIMLNLVGLLLLGAALDHFIPQLHAYAFALSAALMAFLFGNSKSRNNIRSFAFTLTLIALYELIKFLGSQDININMLSK